MAVGHDQVNGASPEKGNAIPALNLAGAGGAAVGAVGAAGALGAAGAVGSIDPVS